MNDKLGDLKEIFNNSVTRYNDFIDELQKNEKLVKSLTKNNADLLSIMQANFMDKNHEIAKFLNEINEISMLAFYIGIFATKDKFELDFKGVE